MEFKISSLEELPVVCTGILPQLEMYRVVLFTARMGAGKTTLINELCLKLGVTSKTSSPTYSIVNEYETESGEIIYHFDLYRLKSVDELLDIGFEEYVESGRLCLIEWPQIAIELIHQPTLEVAISLENGIRSYSLLPL